MNFWLKFIHLIIRNHLTCTEIFQKKNFTKIIKSLIFGYLTLETNAHLLEFLVALKTEFNMF